MNYKIIGGDRKEYGPATAEELRRWFADGRLNGQSLVRPEDGGEWQELGSRPEFADLFGTAAVPPPLPGRAARAVSPEGLAGQLLARPLHVDIGGCLSRSAALLRGNFGLLAGACVLVWLVSLVEFVPIVSLAYRLIVGPLFGGLYVVYLRRIRGQPANAAEALGGFTQGFGQLLLAGFISWVLAQLGLVFCLVPGIYLSVAWIFSVALVADQRLEFWSAMELSRKVVTRVWFPMLGLLVVAWLPMVVATIFAVVKLGLLLVKFGPALLDAWLSLFHGGQMDFSRMADVRLQIAQAAWPLALMLKLVWLLNLPFAVGALMYAYEDLFGARPTPTT